MTNQFDLFNRMMFPGRWDPKPGPDKKYATFNRRMLAATIDSLLAMVTLGPLFDAMSRYKPVDLYTLQQKLQGMTDERESSRLLVQALRDSGFIDNFMFQTFGLMAITGICWYFWSATPGKILLRMKVVDAETEERMSIPQILFRLFGYILATIPLGLGYFWISFDKRRQGWHDKFANTVVIITPRTKAVHPSVPQEPSESA